MVHKIAVLKKTPIRNEADLQGIIVKNNKIPCDTNLRILLPFTKFRFMILKLRIVKDHLPLRSTT